MNWYRVILQMQSWTASAWQADTIFGHLCWGMRYLYGEKELEDFLEWYHEGVPPLLLSNGFPGDLLPRPLLPPSPEHGSPSLQQQKEAFDRGKKTKAVTHLSPEQFAQAIRGEEIGDLPQGPQQQRIAEQRRVTLKNQISRLTGTTGEEGQLFPFEEFYWDTVTVYLKLEQGFLDTAQRLFEYLRDAGYGKRKSVGYGQVKHLTLESFPGFPSPQDANGFISLSNFVPARHDPTTGNWRCLVKYGKMGEEYSQEDMAFKRPLLMFEAGSTFYDPCCRDFYGRLVSHISVSQPHVVQYGFALPVPMKLPELGTTI
ncbi:MAG: hypothetical protein DRI40_03820 [Chloroflexi bacterium]|nr:MAG: hypothetical protein DRI40_03820 [Chloroflexota bacterium]